MTERYTQSEHISAPFPQHVWEFSEN